jgi:hypothetical protein
MKNLGEVGAHGLNGTAEVFNPESLLSSLIDKIKEYNDLANDPTALANEADSHGPSGANLDDDDEKEGG